MKKTILVLSIVGMIIVSSCGKPEFRNIDEAMSYVWSHTKEKGEEWPYGEKKIFIGDSSITFYVSMNYKPQWNRELLAVSLYGKDSLIKQIWLEYAIGNWNVEEDDQKSDDKGYNLRLPNEAEQEFLKFAYSKYK